MAEDKKLSAGFTGSVTKDAGGIARQAKDTVRNVRREASSAVAAAQDHQAATSTALLVAGLVGLVLGYALGSSTEKNRNSSRWF